MQCAPREPGSGLVTDWPGVVLVATIWSYWLGVGVMIVRVHRKTRKLGGLGVQFVKTLMDEVSYVRVRQKNVVRIAKRLTDGGVDGDR